MSFIQDSTAPSAIPSAAQAPAPWKETLALLEAGFPRSQAELESRFRIIADSTSNDLHQVTLQPKSTTARRMMPQIKIFFSPQDSGLRATELQFTDGSTMRNDFKNPRLNEQLDEVLFSPTLDPTYKIVEPLKH